MRMNNDNNNKTLTLNNWNRWYESLLEETSAMEGMRELLSKGIRREFNINRPDPRIPATADTDINQTRDGFLIDREGRFLEYNKEHQKREN